MTKDDKMKYTKEESIQLILDDRLCKDKDDCEVCYFHMHYIYKDEIACYLVRLFEPITFESQFISAVNRKKIKKLKKILQ